MKDYNKFKKGSEWRKWDLHIHTPGTKKNDQFVGSNLEEKWKNYVISINESTEPISVLGITDYLSIENYFKFKQLVANGSIEKKFDLIIPNIEMRVLPVTGSATPINLHCLFNPAIDQEIENRFLGKLKFSNSNSSYSATKNELIRFGRDHTNDQMLDEENAYKKGVEQYVVTLDTLSEVLKNDPKLKENTIIIVSNKSNDGVTGIIKHKDFFINKTVSQLDATRQSFYQFSDAIFSSNEGDRNYFIGQSVDDVKTVIRKCGSIKPCFHGCDAHSNDRIFNPMDNRFCWVKADPTFDGLRQTLFEPEDRVRIQALKPDVKNERHIISNVQFIDQGNLFGSKTIELNENLNSIIGGKSSGKSLLMYSMAKSIDPEQVQRASKRLSFEGYKFDSNFDFKVQWKNGDEDFFTDSEPTNKLHKITYIPQLYINYLVEKNNKEELNSLIKNILMQDSEFKGFYDDQVEEIENFNSEADRLLSEYLKIRSKALEVQKKSKELGNSSTIKKSITQIQSDIEKGQKASNLSQEEFKRYNDLLETKSAKEAEQRNLITKNNSLQKVLNEVLNNRASLLGKMDEQEDIFLKGQVDRILEENGEISNDLKIIKTQIEKDYDQLVENLKTKIQELQFSKQKEANDEILNKVNKELAPYLEKIDGQKELKKLTEQLEKEKVKLQSAIASEQQFKNLLEEYVNTRKQIANLIRRRLNEYQEIVNKVNSTKNNIGSDIQLNSTLVYKLEDLKLYNQINKAAIGSDHFFNTLYNDNLVNYTQLCDFFENQLRVYDQKLYYSKEQYLPLKQNINLEEVLRGIIKDSFIIDYNVTYKNDNLLHMSPGKKGTVLLILFLQISSSEFPILIDQPEDNLDNRTIYDLLCKMIKEKKKERQIIIVSHNANLVVATDTENIIVANQKGQTNEDEVGDYRFEYVNGSLEHSFEKNEHEKSILYSQGIREHVCDILEGGDEAFRQREKKYALKN